MSIVEGVKLKATAKVKLTKLDENGKVLDVETSIVNLTEEEAAALWLSQQQA